MENKNRDIQMANLNINALMKMDKNTEKKNGGMIMDNFKNKALIKTINYTKN